MAQESTYPVSIEGDYEPRLNRFLWLIKWLLALPHLFVLLFLGIGQAILLPIAWIAIVLTGRYPGFIFSYNLGVMRWGWRVGYYAFDVLGTDRYPPFTMADAPDYPARLNVPYPERLSRLTTLVRLILAIPHLIVAYIFVGDGNRWRGFRFILVLFAAIALLFTGRYPQSLYNFIMGMSRYGLRVWAYVLLLRDEYPPFRLAP